MKNNRNELQCPILYGRKLSFNRPQIRSQNTRMNQFVYSYQFGDIEVSEFGKLSHYLQVQAVWHLSLNCNWSGNPSLLMIDITDETVAILNQHIPFQGDVQCLESLYVQLQERQTNHHSLIQEVRSIFSFTKSHDSPSFCLCNMIDPTELLHSLTRRQKRRARQLQPR